MRILETLSIVFATLLFANVATAEPAVRLEGEIRYDPVKMILKYKASVGEFDGVNFKKKFTRSYELNFKTRMMTDGRTVRRFSKVEAGNVKRLYEFALEGYAADSVNWLYEQRDDVNDRLEPSDRTKDWTRLLN
jgi:hypothetical protein